MPSPPDVPARSADNYENRAAISALGMLWSGVGKVWSRSSTEVGAEEVVVWSEGEGSVY